MSRSCRWRCTRKRMRKPAIALGPPTRQARSTPPRRNNDRISLATSRDNPPAAAPIPRPRANALMVIATHADKAGERYAVQLMRMAANADVPPLRALSATRRSCGNPESGAAALPRGEADDVAPVFSTARSAGTLRFAGAPRPETEGSNQPPDPRLNWVKIEGHASVLPISFGYCRHRKMVIAAIESF